MGDALGSAGRVATAVGTGGLSEAARSAGGGKGSSAPSVPDYAAAAAQQAASGQQSINQQTQANRPDQTNAFGVSSNWTQGPGGQWTQSTNLGGPLGQAASGLEGQIANQGPLDTGTQARDQAITGAYNQATSRLDPRFAQQEEQTRAMLANQGLDPGSQAYQTEMGNFGREKNDAYSSAMNGAIGQGTAAQQATFGENLAAQNNPFNQLGMLNGLTQQQSVTPAGSTQPTQYLPAALAAYQGGMQKYGTDQAGKNSMMSGAASLAPLFAGA